MKKGLLLFLMLFICSGISAQNAQDLIDGLKKELKSNPDDKKRATIYSDLTWYYSNISLDSAMAYGNKAIIESTRLKDSVLIAQVYSDLGAVYYKKGNYFDSEKNYLIAYRIRKLRKDFVGIAKINANLANVYQTQEKYVPAIKSYIIALDYFQKINSNSNINITKANIANLFFKIKSYEKALKYVNESISFQEKNKLNNDLCKSYITKGNIQLNLKDTLEAKKSYQKGLKYCNEIGDKLASSSIYNNLGIIETNQNKSIKADELFKIAKTQRDLLNSDLSNAKLQINFAERSIKQKKYSDAEKLLINLKYVFVKKNSEINLLSVYKLLIPVYANLNKPDSVSSYTNKYSLLLDHLLQKNVTKQTAELETKYQTAKKEKQIIEQQAEAKKRKTIILILSLSTFFIGLLGFLFYRQQKLKNKQQTQAFELKQAINQIETQNKLQSQRLAISKDLHDNIGAQLTFIISSVETAKFAPEIENTKLGNKLTQISDFTKDTIVELRDTIWAMNSNEIGFDELRGRILNFIEKANQAAENVAFQFNIDTNLADLKLISIVGMNIYRTIQEAINNALKYAQATQITVDIKKENAKIKIEIADNGIGFDPNTIDAGNGLLNMQKRMEEIGGTFHIDSEDEKGTTISVQIEVNL